ncbi:Guanylate kinase [Symmachiella dynata]|uniref:Guanylate kinase n=1 Tax=Symmachiella dynata TaxID=2527995 RepID=A0A517ZUY9_9PLAN|nr:guanylate kinase [Symmachiella dynata]QDT50635.1 Guanylate kinase [Symmachiella dynata]QDU46290.1 Guanylate kinase [Symmachiella dynata]
MTAPETRSFVDIRVLVLSGPSGSGKSTIVDRLVNVAPVQLVKVVSATTRPPRAGEVNGRDYYFLSPEEFEQKRQAGEFIECEEVHGNGNWYGTLRSELTRAQQAGAWAFLEIDVQGALSIIKEYPDAVSVFLTTASEGDYEQRLRNRGTESEDAIQQRLETARRELKLSKEYKHIVVNDDLDRAVSEICHILASAEG